MVAATTVWVWGLQRSLRRRRLMLLGAKVALLAVAVLVVVLLAAFPQVGSLAPTRQAAAWVAA